MELFVIWNIRLVLCVPTYGYDLYYKYFVILRIQRAGLRRICAIYCALYTLILMNLFRFCTELES